MTRQELQVIMDKINAAYLGRFQITQATFDVWFECMEDMRFDIASKAVTECLNTNPKVPTIADIRSKYTALLEEHNALNRVIMDYFTFAASSYPDNTKEEKEKAHATFLTILKKHEKSEWVGIAAKVSAEVLRYVGRCEAGQEKIVPFSDYMEKLTDEL